jgi:hypothetical protein
MERQAEGVAEKETGESVRLSSKMRKDKQKECKERDWRVGETERQCWQRRVGEGGQDCEYSIETRLERDILVNGNCSG